MASFDANKLKEAMGMLETLRKTEEILQATRQKQDLPFMYEAFKRMLIANKKRKGK